MSLLKGKRKTPNIIRGGRAIPFGNPTDNLYYLQGRSHAKGGIDIGENPRTGIEAEGGEVVQIKPNELRVLSAQDFIGGGISPAKQVLAGANPDQVFNEQERFKDRHRINDDGSKYNTGGDRQLTYEDKLRLVQEWINNPMYEGGILPQITVTAPMTWKARNAIKSRKGRKAFYEGQAEAAPLMLGLAGLGVGASLAGAGLLGSTVNGAMDAFSIIDNPYDPTNYLGYINGARLIGKYANRIKNRNKYVYNRLSPMDYSKPFSKGIKILGDIITEKVPDTSYPKYWDRKDLAKTRQYIEGVKDEKLFHVDNSDEIAIKGRDAAYRRYLGLDDNSNIYIDNPDGTVSYNLKYIDELSNNTLLPVPKLPRGNPDYITGAGGYVDSKIVKRGIEGLYEDMQDVWDINPFSRIGDKLSKKFENAGRKLYTKHYNTSRKLSEKLPKPETDIIVYGDPNSNFAEFETVVKEGFSNKVKDKIQTFVNKTNEGIGDIILKGTKKGTKYIKDKLDDAATKFEAGPLLGGKPFKMHTHIPIVRTDDGYFEIDRNRIKQNGGMIATINGNVKNGLISTPRKKCGGRKKAPYGTVRDVNTRGVAAPDLWLNTIGQDNAVYDMAFNNTIEGNRMAMRHADMREDLGYQSGSGRAIRGSGQVRQYQQDFQNRFWDANRKLYNAIDPAGNTGDNQSGQFNDDIWGEETNVRAPYGLWSDKNRQMWNDKGFLAANYKGNTVLTGRIANLNDLELPGRPKTPQLTAPKGELLDMPSPTGGNAETPTTPQSPTPRRGIRWNDDLTSALANGLGSLGSFGAELWGANLRSWTPYTESPVKLKTNWNINPQLDRIRESSQEAYRDIDANTASSSTALARKQRVRNQAQYAANEQWGLKENKETELINKDKLNLQGVRNRNTNRLNHWAESDANIANMRRRLRGAAWSNLFDNLNKTVQGYIGRRDQRRRDEATERMFNRAYPHGAAMARNIQSRESSGDATIPSLATNPIAIAGRLATEKLNDDIVAQTKKRCGGKTKRK